MRVNDEKSLNISNFVQQTIFEVSKVDDFNFQRKYVRKIQITEIQALK